MMEEDIKLSDETTALRQEYEDGIGYIITEHGNITEEWASLLMLHELAAIPEVRSLVAIGNDIHERMCDWDWEYDEMHALDLALAPFNNEAA